MHSRRRSAIITRGPRSIIVMPIGQPFRPQAPAPVNPASASLPAVIEERSVEALKPKSAVEEAKAYLIETATPGYTMIRQGVAVSIERLHPDFVVKLAAAIEIARQDGMTNAGVYSAYRPPSFGIGGFHDKFNSLHSYGLAVDMTGIGRPGSRLARLWQTIVKQVGLYLPYAEQPRGIQPHAAGPDQDGIELPAGDHHGQRTQGPAADVACLRHQFICERCDGNKGACSRQRIRPTRGAPGGGRRQASSVPAAERTRRRTATVPRPPPGQARHRPHPGRRARERTQGRQAGAQGGKELRAPIFAVVPDAMEPTPPRCGGAAPGHCALIHPGYDGG